MTGPLSGRTALITGASSGIGKATARLLASQGCSLALGSRSGSNLGLPETLAMSCDVRSATSVQAFVDASVDRFNGIDVVVANAGVGTYGSFLDLDPDQVEEMIDVNVKGLLYTVRSTLPHLLQSQRAELVVIASVAGQRAPAGESVYAASKFAQVGFMRALDHELHTQGVRCTTICPGGVATNFAMGRGRSHDDPDLELMMKPEEVADVVLSTLTLPRSMRALEITLLPMSDDSLG
ncbi:MAG: SDR family oxidoreductase [Actinomycetes bacterium]